MSRSMPALSRPRGATASGVPLVAARGRRPRVDLDLHEELGRDEARDLHHRGGRRGRGERLGVRVGRLLPAIDVGDVEARPGHVLQRRAGHGERRLRVGDRLPELLAHPSRDDAAVRPDAGAARDVHVVSGAHGPRVADARLPRTAGGEALDAHGWKDGAMAEGVDDRADALFAVPLEDFVAERTALARALRAEGDRPAATAVGKLRKPTPAAWALNRLARSDPD